MGASGAYIALTSLPIGRLFSECLILKGHMQEELHPSVLLIKNELLREKHRYEDVSESTGIPVQRLKNIMAGRLDITLRERDKLCDYLSISPVVLVMRRDDLFAGHDQLDLSGLPEGIRNSLIVLHNEICQLFKR